MSFVSWQYAFFLPLVFALYWRLPHRGRIVLIFLASYFFYGWWDVRFLALLLTSSVVDFLCGLGIQRRRQSLGSVAVLCGMPLAWLSCCRVAFPGGHAVDSRILAAAAAFLLLFPPAYQWLWGRRETAIPRSFLLLSLLTNIGVLVFFKYFNFFAGSAAALLNHLGWHPGWTFLRIILPVGISFYTFQSISYTVDVYRGKTQPTDDFLTFAAYISFFPQLVAGPIERSTNLLPQFQTPAVWNVAHLHAGLPLILMGLFKKVFVADNCALPANYAFDPNIPLNAPWALLGVLAFAFQIYGDFSGYTDIARGSARLLGVNLSRNFSYPYFARGPSDFWQRWHITLSSWFRDYVYIPLGGNRCGRWATLRNLAITMMLAGLWHGASWTFVLWGSYYAVLLIVYRTVPALKQLEEYGGGGWRRYAGVALMFALTLVGWAFFRSRSMEQLAGWFVAWGRWGTAGTEDWIKPALWWLMHVVPLLLLQAAAWKSRDEVDFVRFPWPVRGLVYALLLLLTATSAVTEQEFIYFQF